MEHTNSNCNEDRLLLMQMEKGNKGAFSKLYDKYWQQAYSKAYIRLGNSDKAKDVVQDVFLNIWVRREHSIGNFPAYLHVAIRNQVLKIIAKDKKKYPFLDKLKFMHEEGSQPDRNLLWKEFYKSYKSQIEKLPPKRQKIFRLHFHEDLTTKRISTELGVSRKTVQNQLGKAVAQLRTSLMHLF